MKKIKNSLLKLSYVLTLVILFLINCQVTFSQWLTNGSNIYYSNGNVGIGTTNPQYPLSLTHPTYTISESGTNYKIGIRSSIENIFNIPAGITESGYRMGMDIGAYVNSANFQGTLNSQIGLRIQCGSHTSAGTGTINIVRGLVINGLDQGSSNIIDKFGIYQTNANFKNYFEGKIGIGTTTPNANLHIGDGTGSPSLRLDKSASGSAIFDFYASTVQVARIYDDANEELRLETFGNSNHIILEPTGNVGIGTTTPDYKLDVLGTIRATEVKVEVGWSDYVFEDNYKLPTLKEVEAYINENGHLPEIPSAKEVEENGLSLGEMNALMMKKIEELTLYLIEVKKENELLRERLDKIENEK